ncbi:MAG: 1-acyl-sn-glycerol-3-phosphate acyltransferase [Propionibacteriaceae bacterium]|nr:1-acyl-sn-glycerol-3-phosphate acyltransferase [Propionibacteriaceae bacterium]
MKAIGRILITAVFWPTVKGKQNIPVPGPAILAGNHLGTGETFILWALAPVDVTFAAKKELFRTDTLWRRFAGWFLRAMHQVPMDRSGGEASADAMGTAEDHLRQGGYVAFHPEGHRSPDGRLYKGRTGVARLALAVGAPIVPFGCFNTRFTRKWLPFPWLYHPELRMGDPFTFPEEMRQAYLTAADREQAHAILREATDEVMRHIQAITGQEMVDEYSYRPSGGSHPSRRDHR